MTLPSESVPAIRNATDGGPIPQYAIEKCRGHWHVTSGGETLIGSYDTPEEAQRVADQNNAGDHSEPRGITNEEILGQARQFAASPDSVSPGTRELTEQEWHFLFGLPLHPGCEPSCQTELDRICEKLRPTSLRSSPSREELK